MFGLENGVEVEDGSGGRRNVECKIMWELVFKEGHFYQNGNVFVWTDTFDRKFGQRISQPINLIIFTASRRVKVCAFTPRSSCQAFTPRSSCQAVDPALRKLFIRGLDWDTTSETLSAAFEVHGEIEETTVIFDKATGKSRGFGFITYKDMESAQSALKAPGKMVDGRMVICHLAADGSTNGTPTAADQISRKIYIGGLSPETTTELLLDFVGKHGEIEEGSIAYDKDLNKSRGFGFVTFKTVEAAKKAIDDPEKILCGRLLTVKPADNRKSKVSPTPVVPLPAVGMPAMYPGTHSINSASMTPVGFTYPPPPPMAAAYPRTGGYTSQPVGPATYSGQPRIPYPQFGFNQESPMVSTSTGAYPKYGTKE